MAGDSIATAYVTVKPDLSGFREELRSGLDESVAGLGDKTVRINADTLDATAKVDEFRGKFDDLATKDANPAVHISDDEARMQLLDLQAKIDRLNTESATIKIGTTGQVRKDLTDIQATLDQMRNETLVPALDPRRVQELERGLDDLDGRLRNVDGDLQSTSRSAEKAASALGDGGAGGAGLMAAIAPLAPALVTVGSVGAGALTAFGIAAGSAGLAMGAFGLAAQGSLAGAKTEAQGLLTQWQTTQAAFTDPVIQNALGLLPGVFQLLNPLVASASVALQGVESHMAGSLGSPYLHRFADFIGGEGGTAISSFSALLGGLGHAMSGLAEGFAPEIQQIDADMVRWGADLTRFGNDAANGGLSQFIAYIKANGPLLANTVKQIGTDLATAARLSAPLGPVWLNILDVAARLVGDLEQLNPELTTWAIGLGSVALAANRLAAPIGGLPGILTAAKGAFSLAGDAFTVGATGLYSVATASTGAGMSLTALLGSSLALAPGLDIVGAAILQATGAFNGFDTAVDAAGKSWAQNFINSLGAGTDKVAAVRQEIAQLQGQLNANAAVMQNYAHGMGDTAAQAANAQANVERLGGQLNGLQKILPGLTSAQDAQNAAVNAANTAMGTAAGYTGNMALQFGQLTNQLHTADQALSQTESLLNTMIGSELSAAQATTGFYQSVGALTQSLHTNGTTLDGTTAKALANQQAFEGVGSAITGVISSMEKQGATSDQIVAKVQSLTGYLEGQAGQYGLTTGQVEAYLKQLGLTPAQVKTDLELSGYAQASGRVASIQAQLNAIPRNITTTITTIEQTVQSVGGHLSGNNAGTLMGHASGLAANSMGAHMAVVGEQGPEAMNAGGRWSLLGAKGPTVAEIPAGAQIFTASETARMPHHADGLGSSVSVNVGDPSGAAILDLLQQLVAGQQYMAAVLERMPTQVALLQRTGAI